jgi:hypothetical protein
VFDNKPLGNKAGWAKSLIHGNDSLQNQAKATSICSNSESEPKLHAETHESGIGAAFFQEVECSQE